MEISYGLVKRVHLHFIIMHEKHRKGVNVLYSNISVYCLLFIQNSG